MILGLNVLFIFGNLSTAVTKSLGLVLGTTAPATVLSSIASNTLLFASHSASMLVYLKYDRLYLDGLLGILKKLSNFSVRL